MHSLLDVQVAGVLEHSQEVLAEVADLDSTAVQQVGTTLGFGPLLADERRELEQFLFDNVYRHPQLIEVRQRAARSNQATVRSSLGSASTVTDAIPKPRQSTERSARSRRVSRRLDRPRLRYALHKADRTGWR